MIVQIKVYLIGVMYLLGMLFMICFPPRNFTQSGAKLRAMKTSEMTKYNYYMSYEEVVSAVQKLARQDPEVARVVRLTPSTAENRTLIALELRSDKLSKKPGILVIGALDGMAWGAPSAILDLAGKLLYDSYYQVPYFNDYDWYLLPIANPDGRHFTQKLKSLPSVNVSLWSQNLTALGKFRPSEWHKNIDNETGDDLCLGTHINRNFAYHWQDDVVKTPERCSQLYPGIKPFSTAEARAIRNYVDRLGETIDLAIHLHASFVPKKELLLYPWRYSQRQLSNAALLQAIGEYAARQARLPDGRLYEVHQSSSDPEGRVAGAFEDYMAGVVGAELVYVLKPYHQAYPNYTDAATLDVYMKKATSTILSLVRGWRASDRHNTLQFFDKIIEF